jgi:hypothetical protein
MCLMTADVSVDFCGEVYPVPTGETLTIGREGDVVLDDNPFLHRQFLVISQRDNMWWLSNVGTLLSATIADPTGALQAWLAPGGALPLVFPRTVVWFTAGSTTYELYVDLTSASFEPMEVVDEPDGSLTIGRVSLTPDQRLLIVALCENALRRGDRGQAAVPQSAQCAQRLGWTTTKFNRKLDNVCNKLAELGIRGLHGGPSRLASSRKARLVEYAMSARLIGPADLGLLP